MTKNKPQPEDLGDDTRVVDALARAAGGEVDDDFSVSVKIGGGMHGQRYRFAFATTGTRLEECAVECELSDRHGEVKDPQVDPKVITDLAKDLRRSKLLELPDAQPRFLPDTVIGVFEVGVGDAKRRFLFAADPDQAAVQDQSVPAEFQRALDSVYKTAGSILGLEKAGP